MIKLIETTTFNDKEKKPVMKEKKFSNIHQLYNALNKAAISNQIICDLRKNKKATIDYKDAKTVIEIVQPIILTDEGGK